MRISSTLSMVWAHLQEYEIVRWIKIPLVSIGLDIRVFFFHILFIPSLGNSSHLQSNSPTFDHEDSRVARTW